MSAPDTSDLLRWALPRLGLRWAGFRNVRRQVLRRVQQRIRELGLADAATYRARLEQDPDELAHLATLCRVTISRFFRDRALFEHLRDRALPELAQAAAREGRPALRALSLGCASGEEPYSLAILWALDVGPRFPGLALEVEALDADETVLERARRGVYPDSSLAELTDERRLACFELEGDAFRLREAFRAAVHFCKGDARASLPPGPFDLALCRNLAFTYFAAEEQRETAAKLAACVRPSGLVAVGKGERLPEGVPGLAPVPDAPLVWRRLGT